MEKNLIATVSPTETVANQRYGKRTASVKRTKLRSDSKNRRQTPNQRVLNETTRLEELGLGF